MAAVGTAVVGHDPLDGDAVAREPGQCALEEGDRAGLAFVRQDLGVGESRGVIAGDVQVFSANAAVAVDHAGAPAGDTVADTGDAAELLGVDVDQLAWLLALVAPDRGGRIELLEAAQTQAAQDRADGRERQAEAAGDRGRAQPPPPQRLDRGDAFGGQPALARGRRAAVVEGRLAARPPPRQPLAHRAFADTKVGGDLGCGLLLIEHAANHQESTVRRGARILMNVHPGLRLGSWWRATTSLPAQLRVNNLHGNHS